MTAHFCKYSRTESVLESVWVFHGKEHGSRAECSLPRTTAWNGVERHRLTGILTEYPLGVGAYDDAVTRGPFKPSREHRGTPQHIARFSLGGTKHIHVVDGRVGDGL